MRVLAVMPGISPSTVINVMTPIKLLGEQGRIDAVIRLEQETSPADVAAADVLVLCRNTEPIYKPIIDLALELGIPLIDDLDDNVLAAPKGSESYYYHTHPARKAHYEWILRHVNLIRVHAPALADIVRVYNPHVALRWAAVDWSLAPPELPALDPEITHIVYAAQRETGLKLFQQMRADLETLLARHGERVRLHFLGFNPPELCGHPSVICHPFDNDYPSFFRKFTHFGYAIGLAPMLDDEFHNCKTNIKFRDYAAAGAAGIYADVPLFNRNGVIDGETGLLVSGQPGTWLAAIERLMADRALLEGIRQRARAYAKDRYAEDRVLDAWMQDLAVLPTRPPITAEKQAEIAALEWWFQGLKGKDNPLVARVRRVLRGIVPMRAKLIYYDVRHEFVKWRASGRSR
ncbi:MAG: hypothetical protein IAE80_11715 [Anaerolinea sp.]|nr:hypothetical protein [Anaerolinea sp.]